MRVLLLLLPLSLAAAADPVFFTEVVTDPQADHSENAGGNGVPFDLAPGTGTISSVDEFVELFNGGAASVDLAGFSIDFVDSTPSRYVFGTTTSGTLRFSTGSGLDALLPGGFVLLGNPPGALNNTIELVLRDAVGGELDRLKVPDGNARSALDESVALPWSGNGFLPGIERAPITPLGPVPAPAPAGNAPVPEPGGLALAGLSVLLGLGARATRRRGRCGPGRIRPGAPPLPPGPTRTPRAARRGPRSHGSGTDGA